MKLPILALFERSLRLESRSVLTCLARVAVLALILITVFPLHMAAQFGALGAPGLNLFRSVLWINFVFISLAGLGYFASAITEEKEEMMLGLLRMTGLGPLSILLGKSSTRLVGAALLLLVQVPFTMLAVTLGGVSTAQIVATYCSLLAYIFFLCNLALLCSVILRRTTHAAVMTGVLLLLFLIGPSVFDEALRGMAALGWIDLEHPLTAALLGLSQWLAVASPFGRLQAILRTGFNEPPVGWQVISNVVFGLVGFGAAWAFFDRATREQKEVAPGRSWTLRPKRGPLRVPAGTRGGSVIAWKDFMFVFGGQFGVVLKLALFALIIAVLAGAVWWEDKKVPREFLGGAVIITSLVVLGIGLAVDASRIFRVEVQWKTLSALMLLPFSVRQIAARKILGCLTGLTPFVATLVLGCLLVPDKLLELAAGAFDEPEVLGFIAFSVVHFVLFLHLVAYLSLIVKRGALPLALAIEYVGGMFLSLPLMVMFLPFPGSQVFGFAVMLVVLLVLVVTLHRAILTRLTRLAAEE